MPEIKLDMSDEYHDKFYEPFLYNFKIWGDNKKKKEEMLDLYIEITNCEKCPGLNDRFRENEQTICVFPRGNINSKVMFVGQSNAKPQAQWNKELEFWPNVPFFHGSGKLLNICLDYLKLDREDIWITNIIKAHPPNNRPSSEEEIKNCSSILKREIKIIQPEIIVTLGGSAFHYFFPEKKLSSSIGKVFQFETINLIPFFHPSYILYRRGSEEEIKKYVESFYIIKDVLSNKIGKQTGLMEYSNE